MTKTNVNFKINVALEIPGSDVLFRSQSSSHNNMIWYFDISYIGGHSLGKTILQSIITKRSKEVE